MCFLLVCVCFVSFFQMNDAAGKDFHCNFISFVQIVQTKLGKKKKNTTHKNIRSDKSPPLHIS